PRHPLELRAGHPASRGVLARGRSLEVHPPSLHRARGDLAVGIRHRATHLLARALGLPPDRDQGPRLALRALRDGAPARAPKRPSSRQARTRSRLRRWPGSGSSRRPRARDATALRFETRLSQGFPGPGPTALDASSLRRCALGIPLALGPCDRARNFDRRATALVALRCRTRTQRRSRACAHPEWNGSTPLTSRKANSSCVTRESFVFSRSSIRTRS